MKSHVRRKGHRGSPAALPNPWPTQSTDIETSEERDGTLDALNNLDKIEAVVSALKVTIRFLRDTIECFEIPRAHP